MALAEYFRRSAVAAAQVIAGFDEDAIRERLESTTVGVVVGSTVTESPAGAALADLTVRLLARLYPTVVLEGPGSSELATLAREINPAIDLDADKGSLDVAVAIGTEAADVAPLTIHTGADRFVGCAGTADPMKVTASSNPFGAGVAACLAAANLFRHVFLAGTGEDSALLDEATALSALDLDRGTNGDLAAADLGEAVLVGAGAIGHGVAWALARTPVRGRLHVVDHESIDLGNLQRYVLAGRADVGARKAPTLAQSLRSNGIDAVPHTCEWAEFCATYGYRWERVLVGVDSAVARREVQATLPKWIANAWTQPGDLGVSVHPWTADGACLACLYLPRGEVESDDGVIAGALGLRGQELEVRRLLATGEPVPAALLGQIAEALGLPDGGLAPFVGRRLRDLYVEGLCGGALLPLDRLAGPTQEVHVPVAHQSALAGILLAARLATEARQQGAATTEVARLNVLRPVGHDLVQRAAKEVRGICLCQDVVWRRAWEAKWSA